MRASGILTALSLIGASFAQGVAEGIAPDESSPEGCNQTANGNFTIGIAVLSSKHRRAPESVEEASSGALACTLKDGILHDPYGRTGSIVANYQFQFDGPPQAGAIYTGGFSICQNDSLAIGSSTIFWRCMSGEFGNLYDRKIGSQCSEINIVASYVAKPSPSSSSAAASSTAASTTAESASASASTTGSASISASVTGPTNGTESTGLPSSGFSAPASSVTSSPSASTAGSPPAPNASTGGAVPTRVARRETFGAVIGILGAALML